MQTETKKSAEELAQPFIDVEKEVNTVEEALNGAMDIIAEIISDNAEHRKEIRTIFFGRGTVISNRITSYNVCYTKLLRLYLGEKNELCRTNTNVYGVMCVNHRWLVRL